MDNVLTDDQIKKNLMANIPRLLESRGITLRELARRTGDSPMIISRLSRGKSMPQAGVLHRIAMAFDVSIDRLVEPPPKIHKSPKPAKAG